MLQPVGVFAIAAVLRPPRGLDIGRAPGLGPKRAQRRRWMERARADLHVIGLEDDAALPRPKALQSEDQTLKRAGRIERRIGGRRGLRHGARNLESARAGVNGGLIPSRSPPRRGAELRLLA